MIHYNQNIPYINEKTFWSTRHHVLFGFDSILNDMIITNFIF